MEDPKPWTFIYPHRRRKRPKTQQSPPYKLCVGNRHSCIMQRISNSLLAKLQSSCQNHYHRYGSFQIQATQNPIHLESNDTSHQCVWTDHEMQNSCQDEQPFDCAIKNIPLLSTSKFPQKIFSYRSILCKLQQLLDKTTHFSTQIAKIQLSLQK